MNAICLIEQFERANAHRFRTEPLNQFEGVAAKLQLTVVTHKSFFFIPFQLNYPHSLFITDITRLEANVLEEVKAKIVEAAFQTLWNWFTTTQMELRFDFIIQDKEGRFYWHSEVSWPHACSSTSIVADNLQELESFAKTPLFKRQQISLEEFTAARSQPVPHCTD